MQPNEQATISDVIIWLSPLAGLLITWFLARLVNQTDVKIDNLDKKTENMAKDIVKIQSDIEHISKADRIKPEEFENKVTKVFEDNVVKVIRKKLGKFE